MTISKEKLDRIELHYTNGTYKVYPVGSVPAEAFPIEVTGTPDFYFYKDFYDKFHRLIEEIRETRIKGIDEWT